MKFTGDYYYLSISNKTNTFKVIKIISYNLITCEYYYVEYGLKASSGLQIKKFSNYLSYKYII